MRIKSQNHSTSSNGKEKRRSHPRTMQYTISPLQQNEQL